MDNEKRSTGNSQGGNGKGGYRGKPSGNGKAGYRGGKPGANGKGGYRGGKPGGNGRSGGRKFEGRGGKPGFKGNGKPRSNGHGEHRSAEGEERKQFRGKPGSDRTETGYKGAYRGGDRNRKPSRSFDGRGGKPGNRNDRGGSGARFNRDDHRGGNRNDRAPRNDRSNNRNFNAKPESATEQRQSTGFRGFENTQSLGGTKSLGYRAGQGKQQQKKRRFTKATPARLLSHEVLTYVRENSCYLSEAIEELVTHSDNPGIEKAFARVICTEVVSRKGTLDALIDSVLDNPETIEPAVRDALRMGFCEVFYLGKPDHVAVDQTVELVRSFADYASGVANFAMHRAVELKETFPFGNVEEDVNAAATQEGFPLWLAQCLTAELGQAEALRFMQRSNKPAPLFFMLNLACVDGPKALASMVQRHVKVVPVSKNVDLPCAFPAFGFAERKAVADEEVAKMLAEGALVISDVAAQSVAALAMPAEKPNRMLEIGAGRGTKTIMLQNVALSRFGEQVTLDTLDMDTARTREREKHLANANINQNETFVKDATNLSSFEAESYDAVFVDAPCSGIGTLRRHPDIRWRMNEHDVTSLAEVGSKMLAEAARLVAKGGQLTFATCTVLKEENQDVIDAFLASPQGKGFTVQQTVATNALYREKVTGPIYDAHFACVLKREA